ncbi:hypothetical protein AB0D94_00090 [Streptomyces sp. NPDC048255]|uniref:hypothetical protein n=1 Tax=Streptomyces TaxID=1883 RepID=UPI0034004805
MHRRNRRAVITSLLASAVVLGGTASLSGTATAAVPAASCTVTPSANGTSVTITGEGFTPPRTLNDGESTEPLNLDANGNFKITRFQKNVDYTVLAVNEDQDFVFVNCKVVKAPGTQPPSPTPQSRQRDFQQGYRAGHEAGRAAADLDCSTRPTADKSEEHSDAYWQGWTAAANRAFDMICNAD